MAAPCVFCQIASGLAPASVVARFPDGLTAFLDVRPVFKGHVLVVPDRHVATLLDAPADLLASLFGATQQIARALERGLGADGSFVATNNRVSQSVPHLHVHVVPRKRGDGLRGFFWPRTRYEDDAERESIRRAIADALERAPADGSARR